MRSAALIGALSVLALGVAALVYPFLTSERNVLATTPQPRPLTIVAVIELPKGAQACSDEAVVDEHSERALLRVGTYGEPASPLRLTITGEGVHEIRDIPPDYQDGVTFSTPVDAPAAAVAARVCVRNVGTRQVALYAGTDRASRAVTRVEGKPVTGNFELTFAEAAPHSLLAHMPVAIERMQAFRPGAPWLTWLVLAAFTIVVPLGTVWAFAMAADADERTAEQATLDGR